MSIEMDNPQTALEKADAITNLIQQMQIAHSIKDNVMFNNAFEKASSIGSELVEMLDQ